MLNNIELYSQVVSSIGVIVSLIFVALQIKKNTNSQKGLTYQNLINSWNTYLISIMENDRLLEIRKKGMFNYNELDELSIELFHKMCEFELGFHENMIYQGIYGHINESMTDGWRSGLEDWIKRPGPKTYWRKRKNVFNIELRVYIDEIIKNEVNLK